MKLKMAKVANSVAVVLASFFVFTNTIIANRPETPQELLKK